MDLQPTLATTPEDLALLVRTATEEARIAVDLEANGRFAYRARVSTVQMAWPGQVAIVDPIAPGIAGNLSPLAPLLSRSGPVKVIHDVGFDARMLAEAGVTLGNVHDTALAAQWIGRQATGLATLLASDLNVTVDKSLQVQDWARRPLSERSIAYLAADVAHLLLLDDLLWSEVERLGIAAELVLETDYRIETAARAVRDPDRRPPFVRIKGVSDLSPKELAILRRVALAREQEAERLDLPATELVPSGVLLAMAKHAAKPNPNPAFKVPRGRLPPAPDDARRLASALTEAAAEGACDGPVPDDEAAFLVRERLPPAEAKLRKAREAKLSAWRKGEALARGVVDQVVLPGHCASEIVGSGATTLTDLANVGGFGDLRVDRYGGAILTALAEAKGT